MPAKRSARDVSDTARALRRMADAIRGSETGACAMTRLDASWLEIAAADLETVALRKHRAEKRINPRVTKSPG